MPGKNIEIRIATTGGPEAARQIGQVDAAMDQLNGSMVGGVAPAQQLAGGMQAATRAGMNMRAVTQNVGYQVQDLAVMMQMGSGATRAFATQGPQLLSAFGPVGVVLGTIAALGIPLAAALFKGGEAAEEAAEKMDELRKAAADVAAAKGAANVQAFVDSINADDEAITALNDELERNLELMAARRRAELEGVSGQLAIEAAKVDADDSLSEEEKIRRRADIANRADQVRAQGEIDKIEERERQARIRATSTATTAADEVGDRERIAAELATAQQEQAALEERKRSAERAKIAVESLEKELSKQQSALPAPGSGVIGGPNYVSPERRAESEAEIERLKSELEAAKQQATSFSPGDARQLAERAGSEDVEGSVAALTKALEEATKSAEEAAKAAAEAATNANQITAVGQVERGRIIQGVEDRATVRGITSEDQAGDARRRAQEEAEKTAAEARRRELEAQREEAQRRLDENAGTAASRFGEAATQGQRQGVDPSTVKTLETARDKLSDGTNGKELAQLAVQIEAAIGQSTGATAQLLQSMVAALRAQAQQIQAMESQIKDLRNK